MPFLVAAFDFLRRITTAHINTHPAMMFPPLRVDWDKSIELIIDQLVLVFLKNTDQNNMGHFVSEFQISVRNVAGVESDTKLADLSKHVIRIEEILQTILNSKSDIESLTTRMAGLDSLMDIDQRRMDEVEKLNMTVLAELAAEKLMFDSAIAKKTYLEGQKEKFEELGYGQQIKQIEDNRQKIDALLLRRKQCKAEIEAFNNELKPIYLQIDNLKFNLQRESTEIYNMFPGLISEEMQEIFKDLRMEHILNYECGIRVHIGKIITGINVEIKSKKEQVEKQKKIADQIAVEMTNMNKEMEMLDLEQAMNLELIEKRESIITELDREISSDAKDMQVQFSELESDKLEIEELEQTVGKAQKDFEAEKRRTEEVIQFYRADKVFRKACAEDRLKSIQETWEMRRSILEDDIAFIEKIGGSQDLKTSMIENFQMELRNYFQKEFDKLDEWFS